MFFRDFKEKKEEHSFKHYYVDIREQEGNLTPKLSTMRALKKGN